jgi:hypothetical protein
MSWEGITGVEMRIKAWSHGKAVGALQFASGLHEKLPGVFWAQEQSLEVFIGFSSWLARWLGLRRERSGYEGTPGM